MQKSKARMPWFKTDRRRYLLPLLISFVLCLVIILSTLNIVRRESVRNTEATCDYFKQSIDSQFISYVYSSHELLNCVQATNLHELLATGDTDTIRRGSVLLQSYINSFRTINPLVEDVIFYYPEADVIVCRYGYLTPQQYYSLKVQSGIFDKEEMSDWFLQCFDRRASGSFSTAAPGESCAFYFFRSDPDNRGMAYYDRGMLIKFSSQAVASAMDDLITLMGQEYVSMIAQSGDVFAYAGSDPEALKRAGAVVHTSHSAVWNMDLNFVQSTTETERLLVTLGALLVFGFLIALSLSFLPLLFTQRKIRTQSKLILNRIGHEDDQSDPFEAVTKQLSSLHEQNLEKLQTIHLQYRLLGSTCLRDLLFNRDRTPAQMESVCFAYGISLENEIYTPFLYTPRETVEKEEGTILDILDQMDGRECTVLMTQLENCYIFLCNYGDSGAGAQALADFYVRLGALPGGLYGKGSNFSTLADAVDEARTIYRIALGRSLFGSASEITSTQVQQMLLLLRKRNYSAAAALLPILDDRIQCDHNDSASMCLRYTFMSQLYELPQFKEDPAVPNQIFSRLAQENWLDPLQEFLEQNAGDGENRALSKSSAAVEQAEMIIRTEYANHSLGLSTLASRLNISSSYLSRCFKDTYGENISHYLQKVRIEKAKELILRENLPIATVALRVGFLSDQSFARTFKALEDETPGSYRRRMTASAVDSSDLDQE